MVRITPFAIVALATALPSMARISSFNVTTKPVSAGQTISVTFHEQNYITQEVEYYAAFGVNSKYENALGQYLPTGVDLQKDNVSSVQSGNTKYVTYKIKLPSPLNVDSGKKFNFTAVVFGAVGATGGATSRYFRQTLTAK